MLAVASSPAQAQPAEIAYQLIWESKQQYNKLPSRDEWISATQLYPVIRLENSLDKVSNRIQIEGNLMNYNFSKDSTTFLFQELYTQFSYKEKHHLTIGKKRLDWGTGMLWNPTNFHVQKDPFRTQNRLEGIFMMNYTCLFNTGSLQVYVFPEREIKEFSYALKYNYAGERSDLSISFLEYTIYQQLGVDMSYGGDIFTAYGEGAIRNYSKVKPNPGKKKYWIEAVAGASLLFNAHWNMRSEYRFREDYAGVTVYDPVSISQHSLFGSVEWKDLYDRSSLHIRVFYDPLSRQFIASPLFIWRKNNFQVELSSMMYNHAYAVYDFQTSLLVSCHF
jgi:hypothetical protein